MHAMKNTNNMEKLNKLAEAHLNGIIDAYQDETREWWDLVDEEAIYKEIGEHEFDVYVRLLVTEDANYPAYSDAI